MTRSTMVRTQFTYDVIAGRLRAYAQLVRLPNVFTALADICLGLLAGRALAGEGGATLADGLAFAWLLSASASLYSGGMVWNDFCDVAQDRRERPDRPIPSGRVSRGAAARLGSLLLGLGWLCAFQAGRSAAIVAAVLVGAILLYDGWLKRTWAGPLGMGACRFLNVLLGFSTAAQASWGIYPGVVVGLYIVGVTWFARTEARRSSQGALTGAAVVMLLSLLLALPIPAPLPAGVSSPLFPYLLVGLGFLVGLPVCRAITRPTPTRVQSAVKRALLGLMVLDAVLATALAGSGGLLILFLLPPALLLGRRLYST